MNRLSLQVSKSARDELDQVSAQLRLTKLTFLCAADARHGAVDPGTRVKRAAEQFVRADHALHQRLVIAVSIQVNELLKLAGRLSGVFVGEQVARDFISQQCRFIFVQRAEIWIDSQQVEVLLQDARAES